MSAGMNCAHGRSIRERQRLHRGVPGYDITAAPWGNGQIAWNLLKNRGAEIARVALQRVDVMGGIEGAVLHATSCSIVGERGRDAKKISTDEQAEWQRGNDPKFATRHDISVASRRPGKVARRFYRSPVLARSQH